MPVIETLSEDKVREMVRVDREHQKCVEFLMKRSEELSKKYGGKVVAIIGDKVVAETELTDDLKKTEEFFKKLEARFGDKARNACVVYIPEPKEVLML